MYLNASYRCTPAGYKKADCIESPDYCDTDRPWVCKCSQERIPGLRHWFWSPFHGHDLNEDFDDNFDKND